VVNSYGDPCNSHPLLVGLFPPAWTLVILRRLLK
jgi:hypothetical protein